MRWKNFVDSFDEIIRLEHLYFSGAFIFLVFLDGIDILMEQISNRESWLQVVG